MRPLSRPSRPRTSLGCDLHDLDLLLQLAFVHQVVPHVKQCFIQRTELDLYDLPDPERRDPQVLATVEER